MVDENSLKYIIKEEKYDKYAIKKSKRNLIIFLILLITFVSIVLLTITEGFMKIEEHEEYIINIENANIAMMIGLVMFLGSTYTFLGTSVISIITLFIKKIDTKIRKTIIFLPLFVCLFTLPACYIASCIVQKFNLI